MGHLASFRIGWENERLALFLLSRLSFVAHPSNVGDDVGSDFFCTLFEREQQANSEMLVARNSFAIQVKSNADVFDATNKLKYLDGLELPFLVGVVDQQMLSLAVFSGEYLPIFLAKQEPAKRLRIEPTKQSVSVGTYCDTLADCDYILKMPYVLTFEAKDDRRTSEEKSQQLKDLCSRIHFNIAARTNKEYMFHVSGRPPYILAGPGSATTFRNNFYLRLAEVFYNFEWSLGHQPEAFDRREFEIYEKCYSELSRIKSDIPCIVKARLESLKNLLDKQTIQTP